jgi:prepilin-type N-terminal cleavage/methylation domain-containing protein
VTPGKSRQHGFTLIELTVALVIMAGMAAVMFGSLALSARSWDGGEAKASRNADVRQAQAYLRAQLSSQYPQRQWKVVELPLLFGGDRSEIRYAAALPARVAQGGIYYFRTSVVKDGPKSRLVQERVVPDLSSTEEPAFVDADKSVLADDVVELRIAYFGRDPGASDADAPTWRERWDDRQRLPLLVKIDAKTSDGTSWPTLVVEPRVASEAGCAAWDSARGLCARAG